MFALLIVFFFVVIVVEALVELISKATFFSFLRDFLSSRTSGVFKFFSKVVECPYCCSVWVAAFVCFFIFSFYSVTITNNIVIDYLIFFVAAHRFSNHWHNFADKIFDKQYSIKKE